MKKLMGKLRRVMGCEAPITKGELRDEELVCLLGRNDPVILEIGCNDGEHTLRFLKAFPRSRIYCFEPDPRALKRFRENVTDARVTLVEKAISNTNGKATFHASDGAPSPELAKKMPEGWDLSGSLRRPKNHIEKRPWCRFERTYEVATQTLDAWIQEAHIDAIDFIWADVQGAEADLIQGASKALRVTRYFYTEYSDLELYEGQMTLKQLLRQLPDFQLVTRFTHDVLLKNRIWDGITGNPV